MADISDTPLVSMVLVDDENNRTTFIGPIINDFTITEDLQEKITQLTTLATNIGNLQTRLQNITNILNTQNIEFTDNVSDTSSAGSKLYIQPQVYLKLARIETYGNEVRYLNITPYVTGKYNYTFAGAAFDVTCSLKINFDFNADEWLISLGPNSIKDLSLGINSTTENISNININGTIVYENNAITNNKASMLNSTKIDLNTTANKYGIINITFTK